MRKMSQPISMSTPAKTNLPYEKSSVTFGSIIHALSEREQRREHTRSGVDPNALRQRPLTANKITRIKCTQGVCVCVCGYPSLPTRWNAQERGVPVRRAVERRATVHDLAGRVREDDVVDIRVASNRVCGAAAERRNGGAATSRAGRSDRGGQRTRSRARAPLVRARRYQPPWALLWYVHAPTASQISPRTVKKRRMARAAPKIQETSWSDLAMSRFARAACKDPRRDRPAQQEKHIGNTSFNRFRTAGRVHRPATEGGGGRGERRPLVAERAANPILRVARRPLRAPTIVDVRKRGFDSSSRDPATHRSRAGTRGVGGSRGRSAAVSRCGPTSSSSSSLPPAPSQSRAPLSVVELAVGRRTVECGGCASSGC